jgi:DNA-directed RNA polymerase specialized sigma24 family protein
MGQVDTSRQPALWVLRAQCGDRDALELLLRSVQPSLHRYLCGLVGTSHADDVLQDVLVVVARRLLALEQPELFRPWAFRIASRAGFKHLKRERRWLGDDAGLKKSRHQTRPRQTNSCGSCRPWTAFLPRAAPSWSCISKKRCRSQRLLRFSNSLSARSNRVWHTA